MISSTGQHSANQSAAWDDLLFLFISVLICLARLACALLRRTFFFIATLANRSTQPVQVVPPLAAVMYTLVAFFAILIGFHAGDSVGVQVNLLPLPKSVIPVGSLGPAGHSLLRVQHWNL